MLPLRERVVGTWKLLRWTRLVGGVEEPGPFGSDALGQLLYARDGYMSANLMRRNRAQHLSYCGRYELDERGSSVLHRIELSSNPEWVETARIRFVEFTGEQMKLSTRPFLEHGKEAVVTLLWQRA